MIMKNLLTPTSLCILVLVAGYAAPAGQQYHVSMQGNDANDGSRPSPLRTISGAGVRAQPGEVITVHEGVYRERINPPRGGESDAKRIVYQAAPGERVVITGSEIVKDWVKVQDDTWKVTLPNGFFGKARNERNPFPGPFELPAGGTYTLKVW